MTVHERGGVRKTCSPSVVARRVDAVNTPNRNSQVTNCTEIDRRRSKWLVERLTGTESRGSSPLSSTRQKTRLGLRRGGFPRLLQTGTVEF
jgi:hypothetical protein